MCLFFFFNDTATTEIYTLSLHDALPICSRSARAGRPATSPSGMPVNTHLSTATRSEEHTSELQSQSNLVCRLLLEKKKNKRALTSTSNPVTLSPHLLPSIYLYAHSYPTH